MTHISTITSVHIKKLGHSLDEIRARALDSIISKLDHGFECDCDAVKKELIIKLFNWFSFEIVPCPEKVLDLLFYLAQQNKGNYLDAFGKLRFRNELHELRKRLDPGLHDKLNRIEEALLNANGLRRTEVQNGSNEFHDEYVHHDHPKYGDGKFPAHEYNVSESLSMQTSSLDSTVPFELTLQCGDGAHISRKTEGGIRWLVMPWQPLVTSDRGVLTAVEEALHNVTDTGLILHTCQFITNVMLQDFPAEVFLQRPAIVLVLHTLIRSSGSDTEVDVKNIAPTILKTLYKLTRSLRFRIYYYCDPCVANKRQKLLARNLESITYPSSEDRDSPDGGLPEANYQAYQSAGTSDRSQSVTDNVDESVLQLQQMTIPMYCIESLKHVITLLSIPVDPAFPLKDVKHITDLAHELVQLLNISIMPTIWLCGDGIALKIHDDLKSLLKLFGDVMEFIGNYSSMDYYRVTYLHIVCIVTKLISNIVPLELANVVLPKTLKMSISLSLMDAPIYLMYPALHSTLQEYARQFNGKEELEHVKLLDDTRLIAKSMKAAISLMKDSVERSPSDVLKALYASKLSIPYHKSADIVKKSVEFLRNLNDWELDVDDKTTATKLTLSLLAHGDSDIQSAMYAECHALVSAVLGVAYNRERSSWENVAFLFEQSVLTEIICHGTTNENEKIRSMAEEMLVYILKGKVQMGENGWLRLLEGILPVSALLQCLSHPSNTLGQCVTKMLDPDLSSSINLPYIEVLKGNLRLLFSPNSDIREEAVYRLIWLLGKEKDSALKLPRLSSLHGLPLHSLCILERQISFRHSQGNYQRSSLLSVLEMLNSPDVEPKMRKSALVQISVMLTDTSLRNVFITEKGLPLILKIFASALIEKEYADYPDSVIPILTILKLMSSNDNAVRHELSNRADVYLNILRSLFLFPNNDCVKSDASYLLCILLYNEYVMRLGDKHADKSSQSNVSLPHIIVMRMRLPFICKSHWKTSIHRRADVSILHSNNQMALTFVRQFWAWEWNDGVHVLWKSWDGLNNADISEKLMIREFEFACFQYSSPYYNCQQHLYNIQNATTHDGVLCALDYLTMYLKLYDMLQSEQTNNVTSLPWEQSFERFLLSHPTSKEDCDLFVNVLSFLYVFISTTKNGDNAWLCKIMKNITKLMADLLRSLDTNNQDIHQAILKVARACSALEQTQEASKDSKETWTNFIELVVLNLCFGDQQHFYNLAYLDWLLTCLTCLTSKCRWSGRKNLLISLGNALIELIISFHGAGTVSYMGLSITRNSIISLNHLLYQMQGNLEKNVWIAFWYEEGRCLSWLPMLWKNRDPLVRASALQLLGGLMAGPHTASQLLNAIVLAPNELCHTLLYCITSREESCIVREQACIALSNVIKNCNSIAYQYADSLKPDAILIYAEQSNLYYEISVLCSNIYMLPTLDSESSDKREEGANAKAQSVRSGMSGCVSLVPRTISYLYDCHDELHLLSVRDSEISEEDNYQQFIATPSLMSAVCLLLNRLIYIGEDDVVRQFFENSLDKYFFGCFSGIPNNVESRKDLVHFHDVLEMYTNLCSVLTKCITHSNTFTAAATFSADTLYVLFNLLNNEFYSIQESQLIYLRNRLWSEIYSLLAVLSITDGPHIESVLTALELSGPRMVITSLCIASNSSTSTLRLSAIGCLTSLLSQEIQSNLAGKNNALLQSVLDTDRVPVSDGTKELDLREILSSVNRLTIKNAKAHLKRSNEKDGTTTTDKFDATRDQTKCIPIGSDICKTLLQLYIAHNYARSKKNRKQSEDKDLIVGALTNLLCISAEAKKTALRENLAETVVIELKELYVKLNLQPFELYRSQSDRDRKVHPLLHDVDCIFVLLMNFMYNNIHVKETMAKAGLADVIHKLWAWISLNKTVLISTLKLLATFTTNCPEATQSLTLTTTLPGVGLRKTPNTVALIHVTIHVVSKEIEKAGQNFENHKLHFAFHILRNAVHIHECRVSISKSNLLQFFSKIHPVTTKRTKPWPLVEVYCLEFLIDFTYYEEGQLCVPKAVDGLDVLIHLGRCTSSSTRILAISILRNLAFNAVNRPRLLSSVDFINLLHNTLKKGSTCEIGIAGSTLWSLVSNNQKGKLIARSAGFPQSIQEVLGRLTLVSMSDAKQEQELVKMLQYVIRILSCSESKSKDG